MTVRNSWRLSADAVDLRRPTQPERPMQLGALPQRLTLDLARTAVVVVDMQNDFCAPGGWLASLGVDVGGSAATAAALELALPRLRAADVPVIWLNWGNRPDGANLPPGVRHVYDPDGIGTGIGDRLPSGHRVLELGSWSSEVVDGLTVDPADLHVAKYRMSGFWDTPLASVLANLRVDTLLFAGVNVDQCVLATLVDAACLGYDVVLVEDLCGTTSPEFCTRATVYNVRQCFGFTTTSAELLAGLPARPPG